MTAIITLLVVGVAHHRAAATGAITVAIIAAPGVTVVAARIVHEVFLEVAAVVCGCLHAGESQPGWTGQDSVRTQKGEVVRTHWKGQTLGLVKAGKCRHVLVHPRVRCCLHGMQKNPSREGLVRTMSGNGRRVRTCWKGQAPGLVRTWKDSMAVNLGQGKASANVVAAVRKSNTTRHVTTRDQRPRLVQLYSLFFGAGGIKPMYGLSHTVRLHSLLTLACMWLTPPTIS